MVPTSVWATAGVSAMMVVSSALIMVQNVGLLPDVLYHDCLATQNLGHAAFLLGFLGLYCLFSFYRSSIRTFAQTLFRSEPPHVEHEFRPGL